MLWPNWGIGATGVEKAWELKTPIYLVAAACAETIADVFLCPLEDTRIRLVSDPSFADGLMGGAKRLIAEEGTRNSQLDDHLTRDSHTF